MLADDLSVFHLLNEISRNTQGTVYIDNFPSNWIIVKIDDLLKLCKFKFVLLMKKKTSN